MCKTYDIRKIDELHKLRADLYEERKHLSPAEYAKISNERGRKAMAEIEAIRQKNRQKVNVDG